MLLQIELNDIKKYYTSGQYVNHCSSKYDSTPQYTAVGLQVNIIKSVNDDSRQYDNR